MSTDNSTKAVTVEPETASATWRIFKLEPGPREFPMWRELGEHTITHERTWKPYPGADWLGENFGAGEFMYLETSGYSRVEFCTVVAETRYVAKRDEESEGS